MTLDEYKKLNNPKAAMQSLGRLKVGTMNRTEKEWANQLELEKQAGFVLWYKFEGIKFRLADNTFYAPDFVVLLSDKRIRIDEVKGFWTDDARVKIKVAADMYPFEFIAVRKATNRQGGAFEIEVF